MSPDVTYVALVPPRLQGVLASITASVSGYAKHRNATSRVTLFTGPASVLPFSRDVIGVKDVCILRHVAPLGPLIGILLLIRRTMQRPSILVVPTPASSVLKQLRRRRLVVRAVHNFSIRISHPFVYWPADLIVQYAEESPALALFTTRKTVYPGHPVFGAPHRTSVSPWEWVPRLAGSGRSLVCVLSANHGGVGIQRVLRALSQSTGHGFHVTIVGPVSELSEELRLASALGLEESVDFVGERSGSALWNLLWTADAGIGILEPRRVGLASGSPLKHRTYIAAGLPFITALHDSVLPRNVTWKHQVVDSSEPLNLTEIRHWLDSLSQRDRESMVAFGAIELNSERIAQSILDALAVRISNRRGPLHRNVPSSSA